MADTAPDPKGPLRVGETWAPALEEDAGLCSLLGDVGGAFGFPSQRGLHVACSRFSLRLGLRSIREDGVWVCGAGAYSGVFLIIVGRRFKKLKGFRIWGNLIKK